MEEVGVTRFNNKTWDENCDYRDKNDIVGCCYGTPVLLQTDIPIGALLYVLEMNTVPGMTSHSLFPASAKSAGLNYKSLIQEIMNGS